MSYFCSVRYMRTGNYHSRICNIYLLTYTGCC